MQHLSHVLRKALTTNKLHHTWYMWVILHTIHKNLDTHIEKWFIRHNILFLHLSSHGKKIEFFKKKQQLLQDIAVALLDSGYKVKIVDVRFL